LRRIALQAVRLLYNPSVEKGRESSANSSRKELAAYRVIVSGRVQGVFYRATALDRAVMLGVRGWVKNLPDGRVLAHIEHENRHVLDSFLPHLKEGPPGGYVDDMQVTEAEPEGCPDFQIRY